MHTGIVAVGNAKGGVGKTSIVANIAGIAALAGWEVLAVDLDPQGNLATDLGYVDHPLNDRGRSIAAGVKNGSRLNVIERVRSGLDVVPGDMVQFSYEDHPLPIGLGQTISQPFIVALMAEAAEIAPTDKVLEVGTGSGYGAAVVAHLATEVWTIERLDDLAETARRQLSAEGIENVHVVVGDGTLGWPDQAPYDAIIVTAGAPAIPDALREQLAEGGRLILPSGPERQGQTLLRVRRISRDQYENEDLGLVRFVPLIGEQGW